MRWPSGVGLSLRVVRKNNCVPNSLSSNAIRLLTAGWPMPSSFAATEKLLKHCGATVTNAAVVLELTALGGRDVLQPLPVTSLHTV